MPNCITSDHTITISTDIGGSLDVSFESQSTITVRIKLTGDAGPVAVTSLSCSPTGPTCSVDTSVSPAEGTITFVEATNNNTSYSLDVGYPGSAKMKVGFDEPTTTVIIVTKPTC